MTSSKRRGRAVSAPASAAPRRAKSIGGDRLNTQLRKGVIEMCILALIERRDMYGYEIVQSISRHTDINEGTVYPIRRRLTMEHYFST